MGLSGAAMKFFIGCVLMVFWLFSATAQPIPQGAEAIELTTTLADSALFESVQAYLEESGFDIDVASEEEGTIATEYKVISEFKALQGPVQLKLLATLEKGIVVFKGQVKPQRSTGTTPVVTYIDEKNSGAFLLIDELINRYAKTLDQATLEYIIP